MLGPQDTARACDTAVRCGRQQYRPSCSASLDWLNGAGLLGPGLRLTRQCRLSHSSSPLTALG